MIHSGVSDRPIDVGAELAKIEALGCGGIASFLGLVRGDGGLSELHLDHYPGMTENALAALAEGAAARWSLSGVVLIHRVGPMVPGDRIVLVATGARHRQAALEACAFLIDRLKTDAPFWKRERFGDRAGWVEAREADGDAAARWS